jgi:hypothetical protein
MLHVLPHSQNFSKGENSKRESPLKNSRSEENISEKIVHTLLEEVKERERAAQLILDENVRLKHTIEV